MAALHNALALRRDTNRARRAGIGRQTTKRAFAISLAAPTLGFGLGATPGRGLKRASEELQAAAMEEEDVPAVAVPSMPNSEAAFRRASKIMRTPIGGLVPPEDDEVRAPAATAFLLRACAPPHRDAALTRAPLPRIRRAGRRARARERRRGPRAAHDV